MSERKDSLLTPAQALALVRGHVCPLSVVELPLGEAAFHAAAGDITASEAYPWFSFSAMDGYAVRAAELAGASEGAPVILPVAGEIPAGDTRLHTLEPGTTLRIMTGAPLPAGADAVVRREVVNESGGQAVFRAPVAVWTAVNRAGEEIAPGTLLAAEGKRLLPPALGLLAALGVNRVRVYRRPRVAIISTGDELVPPGAQRGHGQIFDSVTPMLEAALAAWGVAGVRSVRCGDNESALRQAIAAALDQADVVLTIGGVSVGDYDFTLPALESVGIRQVFHGIAQKPGKPLFYGTTPTGKLAFGLPGNPASAMVCAALYVRLALELLAGVREPEPQPVRAVAGEELINKTGRTQFVRVVSRLGAAGVLECRAAGGQSSYMLGSFAAAAALAELPPGPVTIPRGEPVTIYPLGW
jgi:molybdopterin molybdotransferase